MAAFKVGFKIDFHGSRLSGHSLGRRPSQQYSTFPKLSDIRTECECLCGLLLSNKSDENAKRLFQWAYLLL
jgi:hypothetical protein